MTAQNEAVEQAQRLTTKQSAVSRELKNHPQENYRSERARCIAVAAAAGCSPDYVACILREARNEAIGDEQQGHKELSPPTAIAFPCRWAVGKLTKEQTVIEIESLSRILVQGCEAISGVYMRLVDTIRKSDLQDWVIRRELGKHFPQPRVSEIMRLSRAPDEVYMKYTAGFFGFKSALKQCRYYNTTPTQHLVRRQTRRAAERLIALLGAEGGELHINGVVVTVRAADAQEAKPLRVVASPDGSPEQVPTELRPNP